MAPALEVTHLLAFTLTPVAPSLRIIRLPAGPTLSFRVERYSLMKDILNASRHPRSIGMEYLSAPLVRSIWKFFFIYSVLLNSWCSHLSHPLGLAHRHTFRSS